MYLRDDDCDNKSEFRARILYPGGGGSAAAAAASLLCRSRRAAAATNSGAVSEREIRREISLCYRRSGIICLV